MKTFGTRLFGLFPPRTNDYDKDSDYNGRDYDRHHKIARVITTRIGVGGNQLRCLALTRL